MSQTFDSTKPISGTTKISQLYQIIRDHNDALRSNFSGATAPSSPVEGQFWEDTDDHKVYRWSGSAWSEVVIADVGMGLEIVGARGSCATVDTRLDRALNEDGTLKASSTLNPSEWTTIATGYTFAYSNTTTFTVSGDQTAVYYPTRRVKALLTGGNVYSEVYSATYASGTGLTTVVIDDAVLAATLPASQGIEHSLFRPTKDDGALNQEMLRFNITTATGTYTIDMNDSVVLGNVVSPTTLTINVINPITYGEGRLLLFKNINTGPMTIGGFESYPLDGITSAITLYNQYESLLLLSKAGNWYKVLGTTSWVDFTPTTGWTAATQCSYMKDSMGFVHLKGLVAYSSGTPVSIFSSLPSGYRPSQALYFNSGWNDSISKPTPIVINTSGGINFNVTPAAGDIGYLDGITFKAA